MKSDIVFEKAKKPFPFIIGIIGITLAVVLNIARLNLLAVVNVAFMCIVSALIIIGTIFYKKVYKWFVVGYSSSAIGIFLYYLIWGADAGFGAFISGKAGWSSAENPLFAGEGNFLTRLGGGLLLLLPCIVAIILLILVS